MKTINRLRTSRVAFAAAIAVLAASALGCSPAPAPIGGNTAVTVERLVDQRLTDIKNDLSWRFTSSQVVVDNQGQPIQDYVLKDLGLNPQECKEIEAAWTFDAANDQLLLSNIRVDDQSIPTTAAVKITPAGPIRVNLGSRQYNMFPLDAK